MNTEGFGGRLAAGILILGLVGMGIWLILAQHSQKPWAPFQHTVADYEGFMPPVGHWSWRNIEVGNDDPTAPNLLALVGTPVDDSSSRVLVRLVHGYNMPMCLRIKGYRVDLLRDEGPGRSRREQVWRLVSSLKEESLGITRMIRADDLSDTGRDIRELAFPKVSIPDDPRWVPRGLTWASLRHPWTNLRLVLRARWNASRTDWRTFLKLRQPAWASDEEFTLVATGLGRVEPENEEREIQRIRAAQQEFWEALCSYQRTGRPQKSGGKADP